MAARCIVAQVARISLTALLTVPLVSAAPAPTTASAAPAARGIAGASERAVERVAARRPLPDFLVEREPLVLPLYNLNTRETLSLDVSLTGAGLDPVQASAARHFFRSSGGAELELDPRLVELLAELSAAYGGKTIVLVSGHRVPGRGTSARSYHVKGMAADVAIDGVSTRDLRETAIRLGARGAGLYPTFVHVDVRETAYRWVGGRWGRGHARKMRVDPYDD